jgi:two-component system, OmpR family, sensor histidine kinase BaeS
MINSRRASSAAKATAATVVVLALTGALQGYLVARGAPLHLAIFAPLVAPPIVAFLYTRFYVQFRLAALVSAFSKLAEGDLDTELPPAPDRDLIAVRDTFTKMGAALRRLTGRLREADAQRRRLFADLTHELATPTSTILGISAALADEALSRSISDREWLLRSLEHEASRLSRLIEDMRDLAQLDDPDFALDARRTDVAEIARAAAARLGHLAPERARIRCEAAVEATAVVDPTRIDQVLINLLMNAQRHTPEAGTVDLSVRRRDGVVEIVVEDSGEGVAPEALPHLGERLFRADASRTRKTGGHGLGLAIVRAVVARHGGSVSFERGALGGLKVTVALPATA